MKMPFLKRRNALISPGVFSVGTAALAVALLLLLLRLLAPGFMITLASPLWNFGTFIGKETHAVAASFANATKLGRDIDTLTQEKALLVIENQTLTAEVRDLTVLLGTRAPAGPRVLAAVLARPPFTDYDTLVIDAGSTAGVRVGATVFANGGTPAGTVGSVTDYSARVVLFSTAGVETPGWMGASSTPVTLTGEGGGTFSISVPKTTRLNVGDVIYLAGNGELPVATIARVDENPASAFVRAELHPVLNLFSITWVEATKTDVP